MTIPAAARTTRSTRSTRSVGWVQLALFALILVPAFFGSLRLIELAGGPHVMPANPRIPASPVPLGLAVAFSGLCLTQFYPRQPGTGELAYVFRLAFGSGMAASIILGFTAIRRGDVARHRAWMTRAYALALGAGTQVFTQGIGEAVFGTSELTSDLCLGAGWAINLAVAEYIIRRRSRRSVSRRTIRATAEVGSS